MRAFRFASFFSHTSLSALTWHDGFLALVALGGVLIGVALSTEELLILGGEGLVHQGALALEALETVLMPVAVLVGQILQKQQRNTSGLVDLGSFIILEYAQLTLELQPMGFLQSSQVLEYRLS